MLFGDDLGVKFRGEQWSWQNRYRSVIICLFQFILDNLRMGAALLWDAERLFYADKDCNNICRANGAVVSITNKWGACDVRSSGVKGIFSW